MHLPLTEEVIKKTFIDDTGGLPANIFFSLSAQVGYVGVFLIYLFFFGTIIEIKKCIKYFSPSDQIFLKGLLYVSINYMFISFYWLVIQDLLLWLTFGILNSYILIYKTQIKKRIFIQKQNKQSLEDVI